MRERPRALLFAILSILWIFPSAGALWILMLNRQVWSEARSLAEGLAATRLEQWIALGLLLAHALFIFLARRPVRRR